MISRLVVPPNARISSGESNETKAVRRDHLVPRRLISADARMSDAPSEAVSPAGETAPASRRLMVPKLLVPPGARIDTPLMAAIPVTASASANVLDEALLGDSFAGHRHTAAEWLISIGVHAAIVAAVLIVPLLYTQVIDLHQFEVTYLAAPLVPAPPPPPPPAAAVAQASAAQGSSGDSQADHADCHTEENSCAIRRTRSRLGYRRRRCGRRTWRSSRRPNRRLAWRHRRGHWSCRPSSSHSSCGGACS